MTGHLDPATDEGRLMARCFPTVGPLMRLAYRELHIAATGTKEQITKLGDIAALPKPWDPGSCARAELRAEVWAWLDDVAAWINTEYMWDVGQLIPSCWPSHPHIVHDLATVADQRRRAGAGLNSDALEEWHRYCLPAFIDRIRGRLRDHCNGDHQAWPARGRHARHVSDTEQRARHATMSRDMQATLTSGRTTDAEEPDAHPRLRVVDTVTGELTEGPA